VHRNNVRLAYPTLVHPDRLVCLALRKKVMDDGFGCRTG